VLIAGIRAGRPILAAIAIGFCSIALMVLHPAPPTWVLLAAHVILFAALFYVAWISDRPILALLAVPFYAGMLATAVSPATPQPVQVLVAFVPYVLFIAYPFFLGTRVRGRISPYVAATVASALLLMSVWGSLAAPCRPWAGVVAIVEALAMLALLRSAPNITLVLSTALALFNIGIWMLLAKQWVVVVWSFEAAALIWFFARYCHRALLVWSLALVAVVAVWLPFDADLYPHRLAFLGSVAGAFLAAWLAPRDLPRLHFLFSLAGLVESLFLVNVEIARYYRSTVLALGLDFSSASPREDVTYTVAWAAIATVLLVIGLLFRWPGARVGATGLLLATIVKCFLHDLPRLGGLHRVTSLFVLAVSLVLVGIALQKFVVLRERRRVATVKG